MLRIVGELLHPVAQLRCVDTEVFRRLHIGYATILDQAHRLKLELSRKLPSLHGHPPVPVNHLTRCLRNRCRPGGREPEAEVAFGGVYAGDQHVGRPPLCQRFLSNVLTVRFAGMYPALRRGRYMQVIMGSADQWPYRSRGSGLSAPAQDALIILSIALGHQLNSPQRKSQLCYRR
jgi:hypothetical protein